MLIDSETTEERVRELILDIYLFIIWTNKCFLIDFLLKIKIKQKKLNEINQNFFSFSHL